MNKHIMALLVVTICMNTIQVSASEIFVRIGKCEDKAQSLSNNEYVINKKKGSTRIIFSSGINTAQFYDLMFAIEAGRKITLQRGFTSSGWKQEKNGALKLILPYFG